MAEIFPNFLKKYLSEKDIDTLKEKDALQIYEYGHLVFVRLSQDYKRFLRGTVFHDKGIVTSYPKIMRILHLENGIKRYFKDRFYIEEKMDGYNVRVALIDNIPLAFTRGGFICPFTTDRIADIVDLEFFDKYPNYIICGEVVGPGSPYNVEVIPYVKEDIKFFVFDLINEKTTFINTEEKYKILEGFNIEQVRRWGDFTERDIEDIRKIILQLDKEEREGVVIKPVRSGKTLKFVTLSSCLRDLEATAHLITELPSGFFIQRVLRAIFFCHEFNISLSDEDLLKFARAMYLIPRETIKEIQMGESVKENFDIRVRNKESINRLMEHLNRSGIRTQITSVEKSYNYYRARFQRLYLKGTREIRQRLLGKGFFD